MAGTNQIKISELPTKENPSTNDYLVMDDGSETSRIKALTLFNLCYPVGSIYMSVNDTEPSVLFGGTWEKIKDRFLLGSGDTYTNGNTGGEAQHTLTTDEMPKHMHTIENGTVIVSPTHTGNITYGNNNEILSSSPNAQVTYTGGSKPHNNMPPYLTVNMWKRVS